MPKKLLLADDSITIQKVVGITFAQEDYEITYTDNGDDALKKTYEVKPDIVLADIIMPQKNGYEVCETIKKDPSMSGIPVLLLAGTFETFDESRGKQAGADGYIIKPFESQALIDKVNELIKKKASSRKVEAPAAKPVTPPPPPQPRQEPVVAARAPQPVVPPQPVRPQAQRPEVSPKPPAKSMPPLPSEPMQPAKTRVEPVLEAPVRDKRMEPLLEFDSPSIGESPIPGFSEVTDVGTKDNLTDMNMIEVDQPESSASPIELASPSEFLMDATGAVDAGISAEPIDKKEEVVEVPKPPTFDFVSGESDLSPEPAKQEQFQQSPFQDASAPAEGLLFEEPDHINEVMEPTFAEPSLDIPAPVVSAPPIGPAQEVWETKERMTEITSPAQKSDIPPVKAKGAPGTDAAARIPDDQMEEIIRRVSQNVIEKIAWEVVPELAERIIKAEIKRLMEPEAK